MINETKKLLKNEKVTIVENNQYITIKVVDEEDDDTIFNVTDILNNNNIEYVTEAYPRDVEDAVYWVSIKK